MMVHIQKTEPCPVPNTLVRALAGAVSAREKRVRGSVDINFVSNAEIKKINKLARGVNRPTDVLSFPWEEPNAKKRGSYLGELYLSYSYIKKQAERFGVTAREECLRMIAHGLLHLVGHDHITDSGAKKMFAIQEAALRSIISST